MGTWVSAVQSHCCLQTLLFKEFADQGHTDVKWSLLFCSCCPGLGGVVVLPLEWSQLSKVTAPQSHCS